MIRNLSWDSQFFALKVGEIVISDIIELKSVDLDKYDLVYALTENLNKEFELELNELNIKFINHRVDFIMSIPFETSTSEAIMEYSGGDEKIDFALVKLGLQSGEFSRFKMDEVFEKTGKFSELYEQWVKKSINKKIADYTLVYMENLVPLGIITLKIKNNGTSEIGLLAVANGTRGRGIGQMLMNSALHFSRNNNCKEISVSTQLENHQAVSFYIKCGFKQLKSKKIFHYWKK